MDAVVPLTWRIVVELDLWHPWRDYRRLRGLTVPLTRNGGKMEFLIRRENWSEVTARHFHLGLTVDALQGTNEAAKLTFTDNDAKELVDYGCRGFRGVRFQV